MTVNKSVNNNYWSSLYPCIWLNLSNRTCDTVPSLLHAPLDHASGNDAYVNRKVATKRDSDHHEAAKK